MINKFHKLMFPLLLICLTVSVSTGCAKLADSLGVTGSKGLQGQKGDLLVPTASLVSLTIDPYNQTIDLSVSSNASTQTGYKYVLYVSTDRYDFVNATVWTPSPITPNSLTGISVSPLTPSQTYFARVGVVDIDGNVGVLSNPLKFTFTNGFSASRIDLSENGFEVYGIIAQDASGLVYVSGYYSSTLYRFDPENVEASLTRYTDDSFANPGGLAIDPDGLVYFGNYGTDQIVRFDPNDIESSLTYYGGDGTSYSFGFPEFISIGNSGLINVLDQGLLVNFNPTDFEGTLTINEIYDHYDDFYHENHAQALLNLLLPADTVLSLSDTNALNYPTGVAVSKKSGEVYIVGQDDDGDSVLTIYNPLTNRGRSFPMKERLHTFCVTESGVVFGASYDYFTKLVPNPSITATVPE